MFADCHTRLKANGVFPGIRIQPGDLQNIAHSEYIIHQNSLMRTYCLRLFATILTSLLFVAAKAQYSATWILTSDKTSAVSGVQAAAANAGLMAPGTSFPIPGSHNTDGYRCQITGNWPSAATDNYHLDFPLSPSTGYDLTVTGLTFTAKTSGSSGANVAALAYQVDGAGAWTSFGSPQQIPSGGTNNINFGTISASFATGHTYVIRMYLYAAGSTTTQSRNLYIKNVVFSGGATLSGPAPTVQTTSATATGFSTASVSGNITDPGSWPVTVSGFCWGLAPNPTTASTGLTTNGPATGTFNSNISGLAAATTYHVRAYATSAIGTSYGDDLTFTTLPPAVPVLTTAAASANSPVSGVSGGTVTDEGGVAVTQRGVCWNTTGSPVYPTDANTSNGTGIGSFLSNLSNLQPSTTYYVRAYGINSVGTGYGNEVTFTTPAATPTLLAIPDSLYFGTIAQGSVSAPQSFTLAGYFLNPAAGSVTITAPYGYRISTSSGSGYAGTLILPYSGSTLAPVTIYVTLAPNALVSYNKIITITGGGAPQEDVKVVGAIDPQGGQGKSGFSNRGTDFWTGFGPHEKITSANGTNDNALMTLYFSSDSACVVDIYVGANLVQTLNLVANTITASNPIPWTGTDDARLINEGVYAGKGIYVHSSKPMVAYAEIFGSQVTAATVLFPVNTLGKTYTALNYQQLSNSSSSNSRSYVFAVATQDNTTVEVTLPSGITSEGGLTGTSTQTLNKGDVWLIKGGDNVTDITGTVVKSISNNGSVCQPIAVFSGSGKIAITCDGSTASSDNLFQQSFPSVAWGRKYVSAPTAGTSYNNNIYRIMLNPENPAGTVQLNGVTLPNAAPIPGISVPSTTSPGTSLTLINNLYYEFRSTVPVVVSASEPVMVAQFITNKTKCGNNFSPSAGDPDMIYLSPVEQTIDRIIVSPIATQNSNSINYINVVMKTANTAAFTITDQGGGAVPASFTAIDAEYSYAQISVPNGYNPSVYYNLKTTQGGFNAIAYGYSSAESYAYNAGSNLADLYSGFSLQNAYGSGAATAACRGSEFYISVTLAFKPVDIFWDFGGNPNLTPNANVTQSGATLTQPDVLVDSVTINGVKLYTYRIPTPFVYNVIGSFNVRVLATSPTPDGCNGIKEYVFPVNVDRGPTAAFNFTNTGGCLEPIQFNDISAGNGGTFSQWQWNFGDTPAGTSTDQNPLYTYTTGGTYSVKLRVITTEGCYADTTRTITFSGVPTASFTGNTQVCINSQQTFTNNSTVASGTITQWNWNFGDGSATAIINATNGNAQVHTFATPGTYTVTLTVVTSTGCTSTPFTQQVTVNSLPNVTLGALAGVCNTNAAFALSGGSPVTQTGVGTGTYSGPGVSNNNFDPAVAGAGTHQITYTYVTSIGCTSSASSNIVVSPAANLAINPVASLCTDSDPVTLTPNVGGGVFTGTGVSGNQFSPANSGVGTFAITYSIPSNPCTIPGTLNIVVNPSPAGFNAGSELQIIEGNTGIFNASGPADYSYLWSPALGVINTASLVSGVRPSATTTYTLTATNSFGCKSSDDVLVTVIPVCIKPSGAFTPNSDGYHDKWIVFDGGCTKSVRVSVYNRWGSQVYHNDNYQNNWDGTYKNKPLPDATYYYVVEATLLDGMVITRRGNVTIMR